MRWSILILSQLIPLLPVNLSVRPQSRFHTQLSTSVVIKRKSLIFVNVTSKNRYHKILHINSLHERIYHLAYLEPKALCTGFQLTNPMEISSEASLSWGFGFVACDEAAASVRILALLQQKRVFVCYSQHEIILEASIFPGILPEVFVSFVA